jgi:hypothetical protein
MASLHCSRAPKGEASGAGEDENDGDVLGATVAFVIRSMDSAVFRELFDALWIDPGTQDEPEERVEGYYQSMSHILGL